MRLMQLSIDDPSLPKQSNQMAYHLTVWCYLSNLDAAHVVRTAISNGCAVIPIIPRNKIFDIIKPLANQCGFKVEWYSLEKQSKK